LGDWRFGNSPSARVERGLLVLLNHIENFLAMHREFSWCLNAKLYGVPFDPKDLYDNSTINYDAFVELAGKDEHDRIAGVRRSWQVLVERDLQRLLDRQTEPRAQSQG
jgi:hypothetical protein